MTRVTLQGSIKEVANKIMSNKAANELLTFLKSTGTFVVNGISLQYIDSLLTVPSTCEEYNELTIVANEVNVND